MTEFGVQVRDGTIMAVGTLGHAMDNAAAWSRYTGHEFTIVCREDGGMWHPISIADLVENS